MLYFLTVRIVDQTRKKRQARHLPSQKKEIQQNPAAHSFTVDST